MANTLTRYMTGRNIKQATANGASNVVVNDPSIEKESIVVFSLNTVGGTVGNLPKVVDKTEGTSFTFTAEALDTSVYNYIIL